MAQNSKVSAFLKKVVTAKANGGNARFTDGHYPVMTILKVSADSKRGDKPYFIVDILVEESTSVPESFYKNGAKGPVPAWQGTDGAYYAEAIQPGRTVGYLVDLSMDSGPGNARAFVEALLDAYGASEEEFGEALDYIVSDENPARGRRIGSDTYRKPKKDGQPFVGHNWKHISQSDEEIAARRAELDKLDKAAKDAPAGAAQGA